MHFPKPFVVLHFVAYHLVYNHLSMLPFCISKQLALTLLLVTMTPSGPGRACHVSKIDLPSAWALALALSAALEFEAAQLAVGVAFVVSASRLFAAAAAAAIVAVIVAAAI